MVIEATQQNAIHINVRASVGGPKAGKAWIAVPDDGVPADLLPSVSRYLAAWSDTPAARLDVDAPTWDSVRAEVDAEKARAAKKAEENETARVEGLQRWRDEVEAYLAGGTKCPPQDSIHCGCAGYVYPPEAEVARLKAESSRRRAAEVAAQTAEVEAVIERIAAGEGELDTPGVTWLAIDGRRLSWTGGGIEADTQQRLEVIARARRDDEDRRKAELATRALAERDEWIRAYGSTRLQKGLAAGMIDKMGNVYLDERIAHDLGPDWIEWQNAIEPSANDRINPEEAELDALTEARVKWPESKPRLKSVGGTDKYGDEHEWRPALMIDCPWDHRETAIRYLD